MMEFVQPGNAPDETAVPPAPKRRRAPVRLRQVDGGLARLGTLIGQGRLGQVAVDGALVLLAVSRATQVDGLPSPDAVAFDTRAGPIVLSPAREVMRVLTGIDLPLQEQQGMFDSDPLQRLALELAAQALPAAWFELLGAASVLSLAAPTPGYLVTLKLSQPDARCSVTASLQGSADALADALRRPGWQRSSAEPSPLPPDWALCFPLSLGRTVLSMAALQTLEAGDVVIVEQPGFDAGGLGPVTFGARIAICRLQLGNPTALEVTEWHPTTNETTMDTNPHTASAIPDEGDAPDDVSVDSVPITVSFDLGMVEITLAELKALAPGSIVPLAGALPPQVHLRAGGRCIGTGELIEVDGRLAVEVRRLGVWP